MGLLGIYRVPKARDIDELALFTEPTRRAFDKFIRPLCLHIKPKTERTTRNISWVIGIDLYFGSHLGLDLFDANCILPGSLGLPLLELSGFSREAPCHNMELKSEEGRASQSMIASGERGNVPLLQGIVRHSAADRRRGRMWCSS